MFAPCPPCRAGYLISLAQVIAPPADEQQVELISVFTVPEKRLVTPSFVNRYMAFRQYDHDRVTIRALSPSRRWIVIGDDSEHGSGPKPGPERTTLYLYDTASHQWHGKLTKFDAILKNIEFLSDELLLVTLPGSNRNADRVAVHVPTGKAIDEIRNETEPMLLVLHTDSISVYSETVQKGLKYIKLEDNQINGSDLMLRTVDQSGNMSIAKKKEYTFQLEGCLACSGSQVYCKSYLERPIPKWIKNWLPKGKVYDLLKSWMNRQMHFIYDFASDQIVKGWPENTSASVSEDGSTLVVYETGPNNSVQSVQVYDLPLPVWSPWWNRGTGIGLILLLSLLLVRRRDDRKHASPVP